MTPVLEATPVRAALGDCTGQCEDFALPLFAQMASGRYDRCSVLTLPDDINAWRAEHRTARKRADRAARLGYRTEPIRREDHIGDIYRINLSLSERQGRPMADSYRQPPRYGLTDYPCQLHGVHAYGTFTGKHLVAYCFIYRAGDLALVSQILGHGDHLDASVMYALMQYVIAWEARLGGFLVYNRHDSGTDGLRWFKERLGFTERPVSWLP